MKTFALLLSIILISGAASVSAQEIYPGDQKNKSVQAELLQTHPYDEHLLDKIQKETEEISAIKPLLFIASIIEARLDLRKLEKESIAAFKSRQPGGR